MKPELKLVFLHCITQQEVFCMSLLKLNRDVDVNFIRARALNHRQFTAIFKDLEPEDRDLKAEIQKFCDTDIENVLR